MELPGPCAETGRKASVLRDAIARHQAITRAQANYDAYTNALRTSRGASERADYARRQADLEGSLSNRLDAAGLNHSRQATARLQLLTSELAGHDGCFKPDKGYRGYRRLVNRNITQYNSTTRRYALIGKGSCVAGFYAGWVGKDATLKICRDLCTREPHCRFWAVLPGWTCSRFDAGAGDCL